MKRFLSLVLAMILVLSVSAASAEVDWKNPPCGMYLTPADFPNTDLSQPYEIQMFSSSTAIPKQDATLAEVNRELLERGFNTTIRIINVPKTSSSDLYTMTLASGETADVYFTAPWKAMWTEAAKGSWMTLEPEWLEKYMPITWKTQAPGSWAETTLKGEIIAVPGNSMKSNAKEVAVRQDLMEKYGFEKLTCWDDWKKFAMTIAEKETAQSGIYAYNTSATNLEIWRMYLQQDNLYPLYSELFYYPCQGGDVLPEFSDVKMYMETDLFRQFCREMVELRKAGVWSQSAISSDSVNQDCFANLTSATVMHNSSVYNYIERALTTDPTIKCEVYDLFPDAFCIPEAYSNNCLAIPYSSGNPERAAMIIDLMKNDFFFNTTFQFGIEGVDWVDNGDQTYTLYESSQSEAYLGSLAWALKYDWDYKEKPHSEIAAQKLEMTEWQNTRLVANPTVAFIFDDSPIKNYVATLNSIVEEVRPSLVLGMVDDVDAYLDGVIKRMYDSGLQNVYDELERQYNEWKATR